MVPTSNLTPTPDIPCPKSPGDEQASSSVSETDEFFIRNTMKSDPRQGMELLYLRYYKPLCTHAIKFVRSRQVAEDMVSDLFYQFYTGQLYKKIHTSYRAYLFRAIRNKGYNYIRWELDRNATLPEDQLSYVPEYQQPDMITQYEELYQDVEKAIDQLPHQRRRIYLQFQFEGKPVKDIASELAISPRTVEVQIYRARQAVRQLIRDKWLIPCGLLLCGAAGLVANLIESFISL